MGGGGQPGIAAVARADKERQQGGGKAFPTCARSALPCRMPKRTPKPPAHTLRRRPPFFRPVPVRARKDGWSVERQCGFLAALYLTGSPTAAARQVGMSKASAYCLRARADAASFANAWDRVMTPPGSGRSAGPRDDYRKLTVPALFARVDTGLVQPVLYRGRMTAIRRKADNSALLHLVRRCTHEPAEPREGRARR